MNLFSELGIPSSYLDASFANPGALRGYPIQKRLNDQLLRMEWLDFLARQFVGDVIGLDVGSRLGGSLHFFIYDVIKISLCFPFSFF